MHLFKNRLAWLASAWVLLLCWSFSSQWPRPYDDWKEGLLYVIGGLIVVFCIWDRRDKKFQPIDSLVVLVATYFAIGLITTLLAPASYEGMLALARLLLWCFLVWVFSQQSLKQWRLLMQLSVLSAAGMALITISGISSWFWPKAHFIPPIGHVSYFGDYMALQIPLTVYLLLTSRQRKATVLWIVTLSLTLMGLWYSGTRASIVGVLGSGLLIAVLMRLYRLASWRQLGIAVVGFVALLALSHLVVREGYRQESTFSRLQETFSTGVVEDVEQVSSGRWRGYVTTLQLIKAKPWLGWGIGGFRFIYPEYAHRDKLDTHASIKRWFMHPHNEVLHQATQVGVIGALIFLSGWLLLFMKGLNRLRQTIPRQESDAILLALSGLTLCFISWQFSTTFLFPLTRFLAAFYAGALWHVLAPHMRPLFTFKLPLKVLSLLVMSATLLLLAYQSSLYAVNQVRTAGSEQARQVWAKRAYRLAPGAFQPLLTYAIKQFHGQGVEPAYPLVKKLYENYPFVPVALMMMADVNYKQGNWDQVKVLANHALRNAPDFKAPKQLLDKVNQQ